VREGNRKQTRGQKNEFCNFTGTEQGFAMGQNSGASDGQMC